MNQQAIAYPVDVASIADASKPGDEMKRSGEKLNDSARLLPPFARRIPPASVAEPPRWPRIFPAL